MRDRSDELRLHLVELLEVRDVSQNSHDPQGQTFAPPDRGYTGIERPPFLQGHLHRRNGLAIRRCPHRGTHGPRQGLLISQHAPCGHGLHRQDLRQRLWQSQRLDGLADGRAVDTEQVLGRRVEKEQVSVCING